MKKEIVPIKGKATSNCMFLTLSTLFKYYDRNIYHHNACLWDFKLENNNKKPLNECIFEDDLYLDSYPYIEVVSGISLYKCEKNNWKKNIDNSLKHDKPVIVHYDIYWCPWNANYLNHHYDHYFLITGYDEKEDSYKCIDSFYLDAPIKLSSDLLEKGIVDIIEHDVLKFTEPKELFIIIINSLRKNVLNIKNSSMFQDMLNMAERVLNINYQDEFQEYTDIKTVPLFMKIQNIVLNRIALSELCEDMYINYNDKIFSELAELFNYIHKEWNMLLVILMKYYVTPKFKILENASAQIKRIVELEVKIAEKLGSI